MNKMNITIHDKQISHFEVWQLGGQFYPVACTAPGEGMKLETGFQTALGAVTALGNMHPGVVLEIRGTKDSPELQALDILEIMGAARSLGQGTVQKETEES